MPPSEAKLRDTRLGYQLLFTESEEFGDAKGLDAGVLASLVRTHGKVARTGSKIRVVNATPDVARMLRDLGFNWVSSLYPEHAVGPARREPTMEVIQSIMDAQRRAQPFAYPNGLVEIPMSPISDVNAFRSNFWKRDYFLKAIRQSVEWAIEKRAVFDFLAHPSCLVVEDPQLEGADVVVDGVPVGKLPWEGTLAPGAHVVSIRKGERGSAPTLATVLQGQTALLRMRSDRLGPPVRVTSTAASCQFMRSL